MVFDSGKEYEAEAADKTTPPGEAARYRRLARLCRVYGELGQELSTATGERAAELRAVREFMDEAASVLCMFEPVDAVEPGQWRYGLAGSSPDIKLQRHEAQLMVQMAPGMEAVLWWDDGRLVLQGSHCFEIRPMAADELEIRMGPRP